jgi:hypothetical protein
MRSIAGMTDYTDRGTSTSPFVSSLVGWFFPPEMVEHRSPPSFPADGAHIYTFVIVTGLAG